MKYSAAKMFRRAALSLAFIAGTWCASDAQTNAYIKLYDHANQHPRVLSVTFPGDANNRYMYDALYGHGAVVENPWVAYRVYMDNRQSLDLYVKHNPGLELDVTGFYTTPEQMQQGYGCDVLWAGKSIAAGSFRGWENNEPQTIDSVASRTQTVLNDSTVMVFDKQWQFRGHGIDMEQRYMMKSDSRDLWVEITLKGYTADDMFCTGIQKLESDNVGEIWKEGYAASWGRNIPDKNHPELVEGVGLGIIVDPANVVKTLETELNYLVLVRPDAEGKIRYRVLACGDREAKPFADFKAWKAYVKSRRNAR